MILAVLSLALARPDQARAELQSGTRARVVEIVDGDTLVLENHQRVRLVGIQAPKLPLGRANFPEWPLAKESKAALAELTRGRPVRLSFGGRRVDRYGRLLAHLHDDSGRWIQGELLRRGMARVYSFADNRALVAEMLVIEREARRARRGIWGHDYYRVRRVGETYDLLNSFQLVEGRVRNAAVVRGRGYLNFGRDWRTDFTISVGPKARRIFRAAGRDLRRLAGRRVRVRGWLKRRNGPMIVVTHPEQIEVLGR
ncbi:MAG: thermonuclease family protein [Alphaproteobacteria bacterium]